MRKSILRQLIWGSLGVILVTFIISGTFFIGLLTNSALEEKISVFENNISKISEFSAVAMSSNSAPITSIYRSVIDSISANTGAAIIVFDSNCRVVTASGINKSDFLNAKINEDIAEPILKGHKYKKTGLLDQYFGDVTLTVGAPMYDNGKIFGGVIFCVPVPKIRSMNLQIYKKFMSMLIIAVIFTVAIYYFISKRITTPIKKMNVAVTEFAKGNFERRVEYNGNDEIGELAANFNAMATSLENLENMRSTFVANVSHELRTPMTTISGFLEGILDGTVKEQERDKYLNIALDETKRLSRLVNDLLKISKMESGALKLQKTKFSINELLTRELFKFEGKINDKDIEVELVLSEDNPTVEADSDAITQVITNLVHNAVKFAPEKGLIEVKTHTENKKVYVEIKNSGHGIEKDKLKFIFDRFYKTDDSRSNDKTGTGLGLFIVKNLITQHDEKIWVESEVDKYTRFTFSLPVV